MSKGLKIMSLGVINHGMSLSVLYVPEHVFFCPRQVVVVYLFICYEEFRRQLIVEAGLLI